MLASHRMIRVQCQSRVGSVVIGVALWHVITRAAFVTGSSPYTDSILGKNIDSFLATTSSQSRVHPFSHALVFDVGGKAAEA